MVSIPQPQQCPTRGPGYSWRTLVDPYTAAGVLSFLLIVPYSFPFTMPILFPEYRHYATLSQHLVVSISICIVIFTGVAVGRMLGRSAPAEKRLTNVHFFASDEALIVFGTLVVISWLITALVIPIAFAHLSEGARSARESMKSLGGISFLARVSNIALIPLLIGMRLRGIQFRYLAGVMGITLLLTILFAISTTERFIFIQLAVVLMVFIAFYQPHTMRLSRVLLAATIVISVLAANLMIRALAPVPPALRADFEKLLPQIAVGTLLTYPSDTMNKLYFQLFERGYDHGNPDPYFMTIIDSFTGRFSSNPVVVTSVEPVSPRSYRAEPMSALEFQHGGNMMMTNSGGLTEDFCDFGYAFIVVVFLKFAVFGWAYTAARQFDPIGVCLFPSLFGAVVVYTQVNILYQVSGGMCVLVAFFVVPFIRMLIRRRNDKAVA